MPKEAMTAIKINTSNILICLIVIANLCKMSGTIEVTCIQKNIDECEVDPSVCRILNDDNCAEDKIIIPLYQDVKNAISFEILSPTNLTRVPPFILHKFPKLQNIRMINTGISSLRLDSFVNGNHLELLDLRNNQITDVPANVFHHLNRLEYINLAYNKIDRIEPGAFGNLQSLKILNLSHNQLQIIELGSFTDADNLHELYIESNNIRQVEANVLNLTNLEIISFKDNRLVSLPNSIFENARKLEKIDLSKNNFVEIGDLFNNCTEVYSLSLSDNPDLRVVNLFDLTEKLPNLSYLDVSNTGIKLTNGEHTSGEDNHSLTHLDLSSNNLNSPDIFLRLKQFKSLKTIILNYNAFTHFNQVSELKKLFSRLTTIQLKQNSNLNFDWIEQTQSILKNQRIKLIFDQPHE